MARPPRPRDAPILSGELIWHIVLVAVLFLAAVFGMFSYAIDKGYSLALAQTMAMNTLVVLEIFHLFFIRNIHGTSLTWAAVRGTKVVWVVVVAITVAQFAVTYVPALQLILGTQPVPLWDGALIVAAGAVFFVIIEIEKQIRLGLTRPRRRAICRTVYLLCCCPVEPARLGLSRPWSAGAGGWQVRRAGILMQVRLGDEVCGDGCCQEQEKGDQQFMHRHDAVSRTAHSAWTRSGRPRPPAWLPLLVHAGAPWDLSASSAR